MRRTHTGLFNPANRGIIAIPHLDGMAITLLSIDSIESLTSDRLTCTFDDGSVDPNLLGKSALIYREGL